MHSWDAGREVNSYAHAIPMKAKFNEKKGMLGKDIFINSINNMRVFLCLIYYRGRYTPTARGGNNYNS